VRWEQEGNISGEFPIIQVNPELYTKILKILYNKPGHSSNQSHYHGILFSMEIQVEFTGAAREIAGRGAVSLTLPETASYRKVIGILAQMYPGLVGMIIAPDQRSLLSAMIFNRNGSETILPGMLDQTLQDGDRLVLLYFIVGGC
jgi:hypothetical protein